MPLTTDLREGAAHATPQADMTEWEGSKENVVPAKKTRSIMASPALAVRAAGSKDVEQQRRAHLEVIQQQKDDPLPAWLKYIKWAQEASSVAGSKAELQQVLEAATRALSSRNSYNSDPRYLRIWLQYADVLPDPSDVFKYLKGRGIGADLALYYEAYGTWLELQGAFAKADAAWQEGLARRAQPLARLKQKYEAFQQRMVRREERRAQEVALGLVAAEPAPPRTTLAPMHPAPALDENGQPIGHHASSSSGVVGAGRPHQQLPVPQQQQLHRQPASVAPAAASLLVFTDEEFGDDPMAAAAAAPLPAPQPSQQQLPGYAVARKENHGAASAWADVHLPQSTAFAAVPASKLEVCADEEFEDEEEPETPAPAAAAVAAAFGGSSSRASSAVRGAAGAGRGMLPAVQQPGRQPAAAAATAAGLFRLPPGPTPAAGVSMSKGLAAVDPLQGQGGRPVNRQQQQEACSAGPTAARPGAAAGAGGSRSCSGVAGGGVGPQVPPGYDAALLVGQDGRERCFEEVRAAAWRQRHPQQQQQQQQQHSQAASLPLASTVPAPPARPAASAVAAAALAEPTVTINTRAALDALNGMFSDCGPTAHVTQHMALAQQAAAGGGLGSSAGVGGAGDGGLALYEDTEYIGRTEQLHRKSSSSRSSRAAGAGQEGPSAAAAPLYEDTEFLGRTEMLVRARGQAGGSLPAPAAAGGLYEDTEFLGATQLLSRRAGSGSGSSRLGLSSNTAAAGGGGGGGGLYEDTEFLGATQLLSRGKGAGQPAGGPPPAAAASAAPPAAPGGGLSLYEDTEFLGATQLLAARQQGGGATASSSSRLSRSHSTLGPAAGVPAAATAAAEASPLLYEDTEFLGATQLLSRRAGGSSSSNGGAPTSRLALASSSSNNRAAAPAMYEDTEFLGATQLLHRGQGAAAEPPGGLGLYEDTQFVEAAAGGVGGLCLHEDTELVGAAAASSSRGQRSGGGLLPRSTSSSSSSSGSGTSAGGGRGRGVLQGAEEGSTTQLLRVKENLVPPPPPAAAAGGGGGGGSGLPPAHRRGLRSLDSSPARGPLVAPAAPLSSRQDSFTVMSSPEVAAARSAAGLPPPGSSRSAEAGGPGAGVPSPYGPKENQPPAGSAASGAGAACRQPRSSGPLAPITPRRAADLGLGSAEGGEGTLAGLHTPKAAKSLFKDHAAAAASRAGPSSAASRPPVL